MRRVTKREGKRERGCLKKKEGEKQDNLVTRQRPTGGAVLVQTQAESVGMIMDEC